MNWKVSIAIAFLVMAVAAPVMHQRGGLQQASRYALTAALWDYNTVELDNYAHVLGRDHAMRDGVIYSDKAPGQPFLAVPFYGLYRIAGGAPAEDLASGLDWGLWWVTFWTAAVPAAVLAILMYAWAREIAPDKALTATMTVAFGTLLLVYSTLLFGHVLAACFVFGMFLLVRSRESSALKLTSAGLLGGAAVLTEYPVALIVGVLVIAALVRHRLRAFNVLAGGLPAAAILGWYNWRVTGSPWALSYQWTGFTGPPQEERGVFGMFAGLQPDRILDILFSERGLFVATPIVIIALLGVVLLWQRGLRFDSIVALSAFVALFAIQAAWGNSYAGGAGPRYITPGLPFLAAPLAIFWTRWRRPTAAFASVSIVTMLLAGLTVPQLASDFDAGLGFWLRHALDGAFAPNLFVELLGPLGWAIYVVGVGLALGVLIKLAQSGEKSYETANVSTGGEMVSEGI